MAVVGELLVVLAGMGAPLTASLAKAEGQLKGFGATAASSSRMAGLALGGIGLVAVGGIGLAVKAAADFQDAFAGVRKTVDETELAAAGLTFDDLARQFRTMATQIPVAATELAAIGETAGALGIKATDIDDFTRTVALLGATTNLSTEQAAESLGKVGTILGITGTGFEAFGDILVNLGNKGASTESEIIEITKRFAAAGQAAGLTIPQILAFSSAIASAGVEPEAAGSSLSRLFSNMIKESANATSKGKAFATVTGKSFSDFSNLVKTDTVGAMLLFLGSLKDLDKFAQARALQSVGITAVRDQNAILLLAQTYEQNLLPALANAQNSTGALATEAEKRFEPLNMQLQLLGNNINELAISLGTALLPPLTSFVQGVTGAVSGVSAWAAANPQLSASLLPVVAAMGALGIAIALVGAPIAIIGAGILLLIANLQNLENGARRVIEVLGILGPQGEAATYRARFQAEHGRAPSPVEWSQYQAGNAPPMWGDANTPGFGAGQAGSPYQGPPTPAGYGLMRPTPPTPLAGRTLVQLNHTSTVVLDGQKVGEIVERRLFDDAQVYSSGFSTDERPRH